MVSSGHTYFVTNKKGGTALDLSGKDQTSVIGFTLHRGDNQKWTFFQHEHNAWTIQNVYNGKYLDVTAGLQNGVQVVAIETSNPKKWCVDQDGDGWRIHCQSNGTRFDLDLSDHGNSTPGTPVSLWGHWGGENQVWKLEETNK